MTGEMKDALLPCPFCGSPALLEHDSDHHGEWFNLGCSRHYVAVDPDKACIAGRIFYTEPLEDEEKAIAAWNRRALLSTDKAVGEWQPIEAYPKSEPAYDEIVLLAWGDRVVPGRWVSNAGYQGFQPLSMIARKWDEPAQPTDFMRLPKPPALTASRASKSQGGK